MLLTRRLFYTATWLAPALCWNTDVHNQIGFMAETFLTPRTTTLLANLLEPQYNRSIGRAAAWADAYAHTVEGRFSYQWHWIDTHDWAPDRCALNYEKDCAKGGCVVSAIANQTAILRECVARVVGGDESVKGGANLTCSYALKWVAHFLGDVHQPLHASGRAAGGNFYKVKFGGHATELHAVWDGYIPYYAANVSSPFSTTSIAPFFADLVDRIRQDGFYEAPYMWLKCADPSTPEACASGWAAESNRLTCDYVYKYARNETDLGTTGYAFGAVPIVELRIAKAALRLGTWLNRLVEDVDQELNGEVLEL
ncbi:phospholipase C/P1 nuclease [Phaeosphaeriaceae sp. SRC1lsM3a]|nr:phospholipase C/P1 nuclease [Stagonospora sp. SRC1lsM3a]